MALEILKHGQSKMNYYYLFDIDEQTRISTLRDFNNFFKKEKKKILVGDYQQSLKSWFDAADALLQYLGLATLIALSPEYESETYLTNIIEQLKKIINDFLSQEADY